MSDKKDYTNATQLRVFRIVMLLGDDVMTGWSPSQISKALGITPPEVTRDMYNLEKAGWAIKNEETGRWTLGAKPGALGVKVMASIDQAERKVAEARNRFTRN
jgi:DNA-binding IclR family transcriptional regulator